MTLSREQKVALEQLKAFTKNDVQEIFILSGAAGTGKTTLIKVFADWLNEEQISFCLLATTGRAAKVLNQKTNYPAETVHMRIYGFQEIMEEAILQEGESSDEQRGFVRLRFSLKAPEPEVTLYIVDEASMVSDEADSDMHAVDFGSGNLLLDFFQFTKGKKIVFVGDSCQLPPVGRKTFSPALSKSYLEETYGFSVGYFELTEILRQDENSVIPRVAAPFRSGILRKEFELFPKITIPTSDHVFVLSNYTQMIEKYVDLLRQQRFEQAIAITFSNAQCKLINQGVRMLLYNNEDVQPGEILQVVQNVPYRNLLNGDRVYVKEILNEGKLKGMRLVHVKLKNIYDESESEHLLFKDLLFSDKPNLTRQQFQDLIIYFDNKMKSKKIKRGSDLYYDHMKTDPVLNAVRAKFGYAITVHKAQGGEWNDVFLFIKRNLYQIKKQEDLYRWFYTAITRAQKNLYINHGFWIRQKFNH